MIGVLAPLLGLLRGHWRMALLLAVATYAGLLQLRLAEEKVHAAKLQARLGETSSLLERERAEVRARTATAQAQDAAHAARVERDQLIISRETVSDYQKDIAALRAAAQRLRNVPSPTAAGGGRDQDLSGVPGTAGGVDGAASKDRLPYQDALVASESALRLKALQAWIRAQQKAAQ